MSWQDDLKENLGLVKDNKIKELFDCNSYPCIKISTLDNGLFLLTEYKTGYLIRSFSFAPPKYHSKKMEGV